MEQAENHLRGLGGWLIIVGIGVVIAPLRICVLLVGAFTPIFTSGSWDVLTTPGSQAYSRFWAPIIIMEVVINTGLVVASGYIAYLFFAKKRSFPKWYIGIVVFSLLFILIDALVIKLVLPNEPMFAPGTIQELSRSLITVVI